MVKAIEGGAKRTLFSLVGEIYGTKKQWCPDVTIQYAAAAATLLLAFHHDDDGWFKRMIRRFSKISLLNEDCGVVRVTWCQKPK
jgi:hypothetical protein